MFSPLPDNLAQSCGLAEPLHPQTNNGFSSQPLFDFLRRPSFTALELEVPQSFFVLGFITLIGVCLVSVLITFSF